MSGKRKTEKKGPEERPTQLYLYLGMAEIRKGGLRHAYLPVEEGWEQQVFPSERPDVWADETRLYTKRFGFARPGTVLSIEYDPNDKGTVYNTSARRVGSIPDEIAATWTSVSDAIKTGHEMRIKTQKDGARDLQLEMLEPLREAYHKLHNRHQRTAFIARVNVYLTS